MTDMNEITELEKNQMRFLIKNDELYKVLLIGVDVGLNTIKEAVFFCDYHAEEHFKNDKMIATMHKIYTSKQNWDRLGLGENIPDWLKEKY
jgi:hypothetical protein